VGGEKKGLGRHLEEKDNATCRVALIEEQRVGGGGGDCKDPTLSKEGKKATETGATDMGGPKKMKKKKMVLEDRGGAEQGRGQGWCRKGGARVSIRRKKKNKTKLSKTSGTRQGMKGKNSTPMLKGGGK